MARRRLLVALVAAAPLRGWWWGGTLRAPRRWAPVGISVAECGIGHRWNVARGVFRPQRPQAAVKKVPVLLSGMVPCRLHTVMAARWHVMRQTDAERFGTAPALQAGCSTQYQERRVTA